MHFQSPQIFFPFNFPDDFIWLFKVQDAKFNDIEAISGRLIQMIINVFLYEHMDLNSNVTSRKTARKLYQILDNWRFITAPNGAFGLFT